MVLLEFHRGIIGKMKSSSILKRVVFLIGAVGVVVFVLHVYYSERPRVRAVGEVPVAFWAWRTEAPGEADVQRAFAATNAKSLFLRAGQFDLADAEVKRIRPVAGKLPKTPELHLVYNGTRKLLSELERIETGRFAGVVADTYRSDLSRAKEDGVEISGLQLDLDVPTRLLPRYAELLRCVRQLLPPDAALSVTGLPTWADSADINAVLEAVDFWTPQCYGGSIPTRSTERVPISSPKQVAAMIAKARRLEKPFYAGIAAYGYAILYGKKGELVELRGDIDVAAVANSKSFELVDSRNFNGNSADGQVRHEYRAKSDTVLDGLIVKSGETLVFDQPTAASLRAAAQAVRENSGELLLGICIFRLPTTGDKTTLGIEEITAALADRAAIVSTGLSLKMRSDRELLVIAENSGEANSSVMTIELDVPAGSVNGVYGMSGFHDYQTLCRTAGRDPAPCSDRRANVIRLTASPWTPNASAWARLNLTAPLPGPATAVITTRSGDGRVERKTYETKTQNRGE